MERLRLMCVAAHPNDESLGFGGTLARAAAEGVEVSLVVATRGERGRHGDGSEPHPGLEALGRIREGEVRAAVDVLGVRHLHFLDYMDGALDQASPSEASARIALHVRELRPQVVITFDPFGAYGHPDHIAISQLTLAAVIRAMSGEALAGDEQGPHRVLKFYYMVNSERRWATYQRAFKSLQMTVDGGVRASVGWPEWSVTAAVDASDHWETVWRAVQCHRTQMAEYGALARLTPEDHRAIWGTQEYYRALSLVNGGRARETDLFEGIR
ncbi:MAG: PIG-L family deacetylase [Gemmatimonadetes bacterium]|nr:PIG-L family deacetylase [Gemmatimonadota bacterium]